MNVRGKAVPFESGRPVTKPSKRSTDRAPHMGRYVRAGQQFGVHGVHIVVGNQGSFCRPGTSRPEVMAIRATMRCGRATCCASRSTSWSSWRSRGGTRRSG